MQLIYGQFGEVIGYNVCIPLESFCLHGIFECTYYSDGTIKTQRL